MNEIKGILNVLKPPGMTSFDVVAYIRGLLRIKKTGHAGTLDPGAAGVLLLCLGRATGAIEYMSDMDKSYRAELTLGTSTDTQDSYGTVIRTGRADMSRNEVEKAIKSFVGGYEQVPPMFSAVRMGGKKLYELARRGITVERKPRKVQIYSVSIIHMEEDPRRILFDVSCSRGTYIRTLCSDIGDILGCGGHMSFLLRTGVGPFAISSSLTLESIESAIKRGGIGEILLDADEAFMDCRFYKLSPGDEKRYQNGVTLILDGADYNPGERVRVYGKDGFIGLGQIIPGAGKELRLKTAKFI